MAARREWRRGENGCRAKQGPRYSFFIPQLLLPRKYTSCHIGKHDQHYMNKDIIEIISIQSACYNLVS